VTTAPATATAVGSVTFKDGATILGTVQLTSGTASLTTSALGVGSHTIAAIYSGSGNFSGSTSASVTQLVRYGVKLIYKPPSSGNVGSSVPIKIELVNYAGTNLSSSTVAVQALCVVVSGAKDCSNALSGFNWTSGTPQYFTYMSSLAPGGGYQLNVKSTNLTAGTTYQVLLLAQGEDGGSYHAEAAATFTLTK
jgi:hypothetical protein